jgi:hypothetical protein
MMKFISDEARLEAARAKVKARRMNRDTLFHELHTDGKLRPDTCEGCRIEKEKPSA